MVDVYSKVKEPVRVKFEPEKINALLGTHIPAEEMLAYFDRIELATIKKRMRLCAYLPS